MRRSASLSGASVVLDLLPKEIDLPAPSSGGQRDVLPLAVPAGWVMGDSIGRGDLGAYLAGCALVMGGNSLSLGQIAALAETDGREDITPASITDDLAAGRLRQALGKNLIQIARNGEANAAQIYTASLCLAILSHNVESFALLGLLDGMSAEHPALLALRGYLAFQCRLEDIGRRSLARAALLSRSNPAYRNVLHFTQHVLLAHQFGA